MSLNIVIAGNSVIDVMALPVNKSVFEKGSLPAESIKLSFGGDALNEAVALSCLGKQATLITKTGCDDAGLRIKAFLAEMNISTDYIIEDSSVETSVNIVLTDEHAERHFITNPNGSQRKLTLSDIQSRMESYICSVSGQCSEALKGEIGTFGASAEPVKGDMDTSGKNTEKGLPGFIFCLASIFVSSELSISDMTHLFKYLKSIPGCITCADMTKAKKGERLDDLTELLPNIDYLFANEQEASMLTGSNDTKKNARLIASAGVGHVIIKRGDKGCMICERPAEKAQQTAGAQPTAEMEQTAGAQQTSEPRHGTEAQQTVEMDQTADSNIQEGIAMKLFSVPAFPAKRVLDSTGAGDCFAAGFLAALSEGKSTKECAEIACLLGALAVEEHGATEGLRKKKNHFVPLFSAPDRVCST